MILLILLCASVCFAQADIENVIRHRIKEFGAKSVGVYYETASGKVYAYNETEVFHAASTMKVPVMMEVFRQFQEGKLKMDQPVTVKNQFASIMDGSPFSLTVEEDSDQEIYKLIGKTMPLSQLVERMINQSSNLATNIVIELVTPARVQELMKQIGATNMNVLRGVEDLKAYEAGKNNSTDARSLAACYKAILNDQLFTKSSRDQMINILLSQKFQEGIGTGLKAKERGLKVASKDGWITEINHDSAIIQDNSGKTSIMAILTSGVKEEERGEQLVAALASDLWTSFK